MFHLSSIPHPIRKFARRLSRTHDVIALQNWKWRHYVPIFSFRRVMSSGTAVTSSRAYSLLLKQWRHWRLERIMTIWSWKQDVDRGRDFDACRKFFHRLERSRSVIWPSTKHETRRTVTSSGRFLTSLTLNKVCFVMLLPLITKADICSKEI